MSPRPQIDWGASALLCAVLIPEGLTELDLLSRDWVFQLWL
jgi:hypothetical protein